MTTGVAFTTDRVDKAFVTSRDLALIGAIGSKDLDAFVVGICNMNMTDC